MLRSVVVLVAATAPAVLLVLWFHGRDRDRAAPGLLWEAFFAGACGGVPVVAAARFIDLSFASAYHPLATAAVHAFATAGIPEEVMKLAIVLVLSRRHLDHCFTYDYVVVGAAVAGGFAALENLFYIQAAENLAATALLRSQLSVPMHVFEGAIMGAGLAFRDFGNRLWLLPTIALPILLHGLFDITVLPATAATYLHGMQTPLQVALTIGSGLIASLCGERVLRREARHAARPYIDRGPAFWQRWQPRLETWGWVLLACLFGLAALLMAAIWAYTGVGLSLPFAALALLYAAGAGIQARQGWRRPTIMAAGTGADGPSSNG